MNDLPIPARLLRCFAKCVTAYCCVLFWHECVLAGEVKLVEVSSNIKLNIASCRIYEASVDGSPSNRIRFRAKKISPRDGRKPWWDLGILVSELEPLTVDQEIISGDKGLLYQFIDKFLADVPDAAVRGIGFPLKIDDKVWSDLKKVVAPVYRRQQGSALSIPADAQAAVRQYINDSRLVKSVIARLEVKLHGHASAIHLGMEHIGLEMKSYKKSWDELIDSPTLGMSLRTIPVNIEFEWAD